MGNIEKIGAKELNSLGTIASGRLPRSCFDVSRRCIDGDDARNSGIDHLKGQTADSRADVEKRTGDATGFGKPVTHQAGLGGRSHGTIPSQIACSDLLGELPFGRAGKTCAAGGHPMVPVL